MDAAELYQQLGNLLATTPPNLMPQTWRSSEARKWLGRACALIEYASDSGDFTMIKLASNSVGVDSLHLQSVQNVLAIVHRAFARAELAAPAAIQGAFIPVGGTFTMISALTKIFESATSSALIVDPHADANLLTEYALLAPENVSLMVLADQATHKAGLKPAAQSWVKQFGQSRPLQVRLAPERTLHDRVIIVDDRDAWTLGQSFNALAKRSSTSLVHVDADTAKLKINAYNQLWAGATPV
jgi:hypothetical protein